MHELSDERGSTRPPSFAPPTQIDGHNLHACNSPTRRRGGKLHPSLWQGVMQFCADRLSLLSLARCCRSTLQAASDDDAWSALMAPIPLRSNQAKLAAKIRASTLLRHAPLRLQWTTESLDSSRTTTLPHAVESNPDDSAGDAAISDKPLPPQVHVSSEEVAFVLSLPRLVGLDASRRIGVSQDVWAMMLPHGACRGLVCLKICFDDAPAASLSSADAPLLRPPPRRAANPSALPLSSSSPPPRPRSRFLVMLDLLHRLQLSELTRVEMVLRRSTSVAQQGAGGGAVTRQLLLLQRPSRDASQWHLSLDSMPTAESREILLASSLPPLDHLTLKSTSPSTLASPTPAALSPVDDLFSVLAALPSLRFLTLVAADSDWSTSGAMSKLAAKCAASLPRLQLACLDLARRVVLVR